MAKKIKTPARCKVLVYCTAADGERYGLYGETSGHFTRDSVSHVLAKAAV